jgi:hypothetical protein
MPRPLPLAASNGRNENGLDLYRIQQDSIYNQHSTNANYNKSLYVPVLVAEKYHLG